MYHVSIPKISKEDLMSRYQRIKPIVEINGIKYFMRDFTEQELTGISYIGNVNEDKREAVDMNKYKPLTDLDFECLHKYGYYGIFKPSIAEVLAQIEERYLDSVCAFEIIESPSTAKDINRNEIIFNNGFHISKVRLYYKAD